MKDSDKSKLSAREEEIMSAIRKNNGIRIKDLARLLDMWDSNLRKKINILRQKGLVEKFIHDKYTCVRIRTELDK